MTNQSEAQQILNAVDTRISQSVKSGAHVEITYGKVHTVSGRMATVLIGGETDPLNASTDFRIPGHLIVQVNDPVRVAIDDRGHRWIDEVIPVLAAPKIAININSGQILSGDGTVEPSTPYAPNPLVVGTAAGTAGLVDVEGGGSGNEGGQVNLRGAGSNLDWSIDNFAGKFRIFDASERFVVQSVHPQVVANNNFRVYGTSEFGGDNVIGANQSRNTSEFWLAAKSLIAIGESVNGSGNPYVFFWRTASGLESGGGMRIGMPGSTTGLTVEQSSGTDVAYGSETWTEVASFNRGGLLNLGQGLLSTVAGYGGVRSLNLNTASGSTQSQLWFEVNNTPRGLLRADTSGNIVVSGSGTGGTYLAWDGGSDGVYIGDGAGTRRLRLGIDTGGLIQFGSTGDTNLYRGGASILKTDDQFQSSSLQVNGDSYLNAVYIGVAGGYDTYLSRAAAGRIGIFTSSGSGQAFDIGNDLTIYDVNIANAIGFKGQQDPTTAAIHFGSGLDTNLYRAGANQLQTDDNFYAAGWIQTATDFYSVSGNLYFWGGSSWDTRLRRGGAGQVASASFYSDGYIYEHGGYQVPAYRSAGGGAAGAWLWVGTTDPGGTANEGDIWVKK